MPLGLVPRETQDLLAPQPSAETTTPVEPGFFAGSLSAIGSGIAEGATKLALSALPADRSLNVGMPPIGAPDWAYKAYEERQHEAERISDDEYAARLAADSTAVIGSFAPNPRTTGLAGQTLHGLASGLTRILAGGVVAGPLGGAIAVGGSEGAATTRELAAAGVDEDTAHALGAGSALFAGAGALLPGGMGTTLAQRMVSGAALQTALGATNRAMMHTVLDEAGNTQMAAAYKPLDGAAMMADAVLGSAFGLVHQVVFRPSQIDAAHAIKDADQIETSAPGPAADAASRTGLVDNVSAHTETLLNDRTEPPNTADVAYVPNPAQEAARAARADATLEAAAEAGARPVEAPVEPQSVADAIGETIARTKAKMDAEAAVAPEGEAAPVLDPVTAEAVGQAQAILDRTEGLKIENDDGELVDAADSLRRAMDDIGQAQGAGELHRVAAACFGRG